LLTYGFSKFNEMQVSRTRLVAYEHSKFKFKAVHWLLQDPIAAQRINEHWRALSLQIPFIALINGSNRVQTTKSER
jgi:hypothetical protein